MQQGREREEHYGWVPFPGSKEILTFDQINFSHGEFSNDENIFSGTMTFSLTVETDLHVGSGIFELSEDAGFPKGFVVRGAVKRNGVLVIPGSSLKGSIRSAYECITKSCLSKFEFGRKDNYSTTWNKSKIPAGLVRELTKGETRKEGKVKVFVDKEEKEIRGIKTCPEVEDPRSIKLCPGCALFGAMGYLGRLSFSDALPTTPIGDKSPLRIASANSPHLHTAGVPEVKDKGSIQVSHLKGRRVYYRQRQIKGGTEPIDYIPKGTVLKFKVGFENVTGEELGGVFTAMGLDLGAPLCFRIGGGKPLGLGEVQFHLLEMDYLTEGHVRSSFLSFDLKMSTPENLSQFIKEKIQSFRKSSMFFEDGLKEFSHITMKTAHAERRPRYGRGRF